MDLSTLPHLIELIEDASSISEADKKMFITAIAEDRVTGDLFKQMAIAMASEATCLEQEVAEIDTDIAQLEEALGTEEQKLSVAGAQLLSEHEAELAEVIKGFENEANVLEKEISTTIERDYSIDEQAEADAIREGLKE